MSCWGEEGWSLVEGWPNGGAISVPTLPPSLQLARKRSRAMDYLWKSQTYLRSPQESLRLEAVRFIGEPLAPGCLSLPGSLCPSA